MTVLVLMLSTASLALTATALTVPVAHYDARGDDNYAANLNDEYVVFGNTTTTNITMTGWRVHDKWALHVYSSFPRGYVLGLGESVTLHSGRGTNSSAHLYWQRFYGAVWDNDHDTVAIRSSAGTIAVARSW